MGSSLSDAIARVNNRYSEMSRISRNESFNPPLRGVYGRAIENNYKIQHLIIKHGIQG